MTITLLTLLGLALVDSVNPSALAVTLYLLTTRAYLPKVLAYIAGVFGTYLTIGILLMLGLDVILPSIAVILNNPFTDVVRRILGAAMLLYALLAPDKPIHKPRNFGLPASQSLGVMVVVGASVTAMELPTALPYFAAIALLTNLQLSVAQWLPLLVVYNAIFILPPLLLLGIRAGFGELVQGRLGGYREKLQEKSREIWLWIVGIVGFHLMWWTP